MGDHPFFALLLMYLKFVAVPDMKKISTNGRCVYFSPDFVDKLYDRELDYVLCHQIMHIVCGQIWRPQDLSGDEYHFACDILVNTLLLECGFEEDRYAHLGCIHRTIPSVDLDATSLTPEEIYDLLPYSLYMFDEQARSKFLVDNDLWWDNKEENGLVGEIILDLPDLDGMLGRTSKKELVEADCEGNGNGEIPQKVWQARAAMTASSLETMEKNSSGAGDVPSFVKRMIEKMKESSIDWKRILNSFIQERICDYSFSPPDRRYADTGFFLPDFNEKDFVSKEILFMVDTSGSVKDEELATVYSEIRGGIEQFGGRLMGKLGFFDAEVTPPLPFESVDDLMSIIPYGGGGTDFRAIFDYIRKNQYDNLPACVVVFTDGDGPYPHEAQTMEIPVLWIISNSDITPPFGKTVRIAKN